MKMIWYGLKNLENCHVLANQFHGNFCSKTLSYREIKSVFRDVKWCINASWGLKGLRVKTALVQRVLCLGVSVNRKGGAWIIKFVPWGGGGVWGAGSTFLTLITLKYFYINHGNQSGFSNLKSSKILCPLIYLALFASFEYLCYGSSAIINSLLDRQNLRRWIDVVQMLYKCFMFAGYIDVRCWRLYESDVYRRQNLTSNVGC